MLKKSLILQCLALFLLLACQSIESLAEAHIVPMPDIQPKDQGKLKILTLNVWGLPGPIGTNTMPRMERIAKSLADYDVVNLQETFHDDSEVIGKTAPFKYQHRHNNSGFFKIGSGLFTLSKYPIVKIDFDVFKSCTDFDCFSNKSVLFTRIAHPDLGLIDIYTTHFQAGGNKEASQIRQSEDVPVLQRLVQKNNQGYPTIITGDMNFDYKSEEYNNFVSLLNVTDTFTAIHPDEPGYTELPSNPNHKGGSKRLDYIFTLNNTPYSLEVLESKVVFDQPIEGYYVSDHFGVYSHLSFKKK